MSTLTLLYLHQKIVYIRREELNLNEIQFEYNAREVQPSKTPTALNNSLDTIGEIDVLAWAYLSDVLVARWRGVCFSYRILQGYLSNFARDDSKFCCFYFCCC